MHAQMGFTDESSNLDQLRRIDPKASRPQLRPAVIHEARSDQRQIGLQVIVIADAMYRSVL